MKRLLCITLAIMMLLSGVAYASEEDECYISTYEGLRGFMETNETHAYIIPDGDFGWPSGEVTLTASVEKKLTVNKNWSVPENVTLENVSIDANGTDGAPIALSILGKVGGTHSFHQFSHVNLTLAEQASFAGSVTIWNGSSLQANGARMDGLIVAGSETAPNQAENIVTFSGDLYVESLNIIHGVLQIQSGARLCALNTSANNDPSPAVHRIDVLSGGSLEIINRCAAQVQVKNGGRMVAKGGASCTKIEEKVTLEEGATLHSYGFLALDEAEPSGALSGAGIVYLYNGYSLVYYPQGGEEIHYEENTGIPQVDSTIQFVAAACTHQDSEEGVYDYDVQYHWQICTICQESVSRMSSHTFTLSKEGEDSPVTNYACLCGHTFQVTDDSGVCGENVNWQLKEGKLELVGSGAMTDYDIWVAGGKPPWHDSALGITEITVGEGITTLGQYMAEGAAYLKKVTLPSTLKTIGMAAFESCNNLESVNLPAGLEAIGSYAFYGCKLTEVVIPKGVSAIERNSFCRNWNLTDLVIPETVTKIDVAAFYGCNNLTDIYFGGTEEQWNAISVGENNECLQNATVHFEAGAFTKTTEKDGVFTVKPMGVPEGTSILFACYKGGVLVYVGEKTFANEELTFEPTAQYDEVKILAWNKGAGLTPVTQGETL